MNLQLSASESAFQQEVRHFFECDYPQYILEKVRRGDRLSREDHCVSQAALQSKQWLGIGWPKAHGGPGWTENQRYIFESELERIGAPNIIPMAVIYVGPIIVEFGTPEQQQRWLPDILSSTSMWAQGYSEPESGSDLASLGLRADRNGDDYILNGNKVWTTLGHWADWIFCLVRTSKGERKQEGISFVCVDMRSAGITIHPIITMNGAWELNRISFDNVRVPIINRIGEEGRGWHYANVLLSTERLSYAHIGKKKADLRKLRILAGDAPSDNYASLMDEPLFAAKLAALEIEVAVLEVWVLRALDGELAQAAVSSLKIKCTECAQTITELFMLLSGRSAMAFPDINLADWQGVLLSTPSYGVMSADSYLFERSQTIYGGTSEIQRNIIWKSLIR